MKTLLDLLRVARKHERSILYAAVVLLLYKRKYKMAAILGLFELHSRRAKCGRADLVKIGAETRLYNKYLGLNVVTFRDDETLTALALQTLAPTHSASSHHVVFLSADGHCALWAPVMAKLISGSVVVHACAISETTIGKLSTWIRHDLITNEATDRVTLVAHAQESTAALAAFIRSSPELTGVVNCIFINPLANSRLLFPRSLPFKDLLLSSYAAILARFISFSRVLHDRLVPFVDPIILEYALLNAKTGTVSATVPAMDTSTPFPAPLALVCGDQDWSSGRSKYEELNARLGGAKDVTFLRGLGSFPQLEDPEKMADTLATFIDFKSAPAN